MSLSTYALITTDELKTALSLSGTTMDAVIEGIINRVSDMLEAYMGRHIITRGGTGITEYHSFDSLRSELFLTQYPIATISSVKEGYWSGGTWVATTTLTILSDYVADMPAGKLIRLSSGGCASWATGFETVQIIYAAGVAATANVPQAIKDVALSLAARKFREVQRGGEAAQQYQDGLGMITRFMPSELLRMEKEALGPWRSWDYSTTGRVA